MRIGRSHPKLSDNKRITSTSISVTYLLIVPKVLLFPIILKATMYEQVLPIIPPPLTPLVPNQNSSSSLVFNSLNNAVGCVQLSIQHAQSADFTKKQIEKLYMTRYARTRKKKKTHHKGINIHNV